MPTEWWERQLKKPFLNLNQAIATLSPFMPETKRWKDYVKGFQDAWTECERQRVKKETES